MKILFFSPFSNIWDHALPENLIAEGLQSNNVEIVTVKCDGLLSSFCVAMSAAGLTASDSLKKKQSICRACKKRKNLLLNEFGFPQINLEEHLSSEDFALTEKIVSGVDSQNWIDLVFKNISIGKYAAYEFLLNYKLLGTDIPDELFPLYLEQLNNCLLTFIAAEKILKAELPDAVITYNRLYSANHAFLAVAEYLNIPTYSLQNGGHIVKRSETMTMFSGSQTQLQVFERPEWSTYANQPLSKAEIELVSSHIEGLLTGNSAFAYSSAYSALDPISLLKLLKIPEGKKIALIPMSSEDELNAAELADLIPDRSHLPNLYLNQFEWIEALFRYAKTRPDIVFILRLHPRMFPNKRENVVAPIVEKAMALVKKAPPNVIINSPIDNVSLYDILQITNLVLGYRTSVGSEFAAFGIPVVAPANKDFFTYPNELHEIGYSEPEYFRLIDKNLVGGWSIEHMRQAYRWYSFLFTRIAVDFSGSISSKPLAIRPKKPGLKLWLWRKMVFLVITIGPMVREKAMLKGRTASKLSKDVIFDAIQNKRGSLAESTVWPKRENSFQTETELIRSQLEKWCNGIWKDITAPNSLAQQIRDSLKFTEGFSVDS